MTGRQLEGAEKPAKSYVKAGVLRHKESLFSGGGATNVASQIKNSFKSAGAKTLRTNYHFCLR